MSATVDQMLGRLAEFLKSEAKTETIIGKQFQLGEFSCVPVMSIGLGFGGGGGEGKGNGVNDGESSGAGLGMGPVGFLIAKGSDIRFIPTHSSKELTAVFEKLPDLLEVYFDKNETGEHELAASCTI